MKEDNINKTITDFQEYLEEVRKLAKPLDEDQKKSLNAILTSVLILLVALKKSSNLGSFSYSIFDY